MAPKLTTEFVGTFFLVLVIALCVTGGNADVARLAAIPIGLGLMVLVYMGGHISGAHYNPAVTLAVFLRGGMEPGRAGIYILVQIAAAVAATFASRGITGNLLAVAPAPGVSAATALVVEALFTFLLALVVLNVATAKATTGNQYYGAAIGSTVLAAAFAGGGISGGAFNPAVGLG
ncbi:MAG TPA: aquaporin, partial [Phycisphaerales bacterium]|nr:aquaporin [Phycisphaerales bacterium]